jgi:N-acetylmuramoyl-L-alanine amidase
MWADRPGKSHYTVVMRFGFVPPVFISIIACFLASPLLAQADGVGTPRLSPHPTEGFTRLVMDAPSKPKWSVEIRGRNLTLSLKPASATTVSASSDTTEVAEWKLEQRGGSANLSLKTTFDLATNRGYRVFALDADKENPYRVVLDIGSKLGAPSSSVTTLAVAKPPAARPPKRQLTVVLDPGHGGIDPGAVGYVIEKRVTLNVGLKVRAILEAAGVNVIMTRSTDYAVQKNSSLSEKRRDLFSRANMASTDRNVFVSIHVNSSTASSASGIGTYVFGEPLESSTLAQAERENGGGSIGRELTRQARNAARDLINDQLVQENLKYSRVLASAVQAGLLYQSGARSRGVHPSPYMVIRYARIPAILTEIGFGSNPTEGRNLGTSWYTQKIAKGIAAGILQFLNPK